MMTSSGNRYAALQDNDHEGSDEVFTTPDSADHVAKINTVVNDQEGWEDDIEIDQDDSEVFDDMTFPYSQSGGLLAIAEETLLEDEKPPVVPEQRQTATMN